MKKGTTIQIAPSGIIGGLQRNEGCCIFGSDSNGQVDYFIPEIEGCAAKHFVIQYNMKRNAYFMKELGSGITVKLNQVFVLYCNEDDRQ